MIKVPDDMVTPTDKLEDLIQDMFGDLPTRHADLDYIVGRCILTHTNADVDRINDMVMQLMPGEVSQPGKSTHCKVLFVGILCTLRYVYMLL